MARPVITLTTDFGEVDAYVAAMKGVILGICPGARLVDISHLVRPHAIPQAAYLLSTAAPYFPAGTVHVAVVDPGVGTARRAVAVAAERATYVAPDNGLLALALADDPPRKAVQLTSTRYHLARVSATFHGRDIFAPTAAHLACGVPLEELGEGVDLASLYQPEAPLVRLEDGGPWQAQVIHVDHFGNAIVNVQIEAQATSDAGVFVQVRDRRIVGLHRTFGDVAPGEVLLYRGSGGYLEIAVRGGSAAREIGIDVGDTLLIEKVQDR
ncbi:MAG TPA: SAM-dependent chlorinase/fluorinase [Anaerolineae bacterium]|nr:SAM-dependent chlorinase/fluorinase [Anaerolineae bacterium]